MSSDQGDSPDDTVGYGRPPKSGQFRKGRSGNPRGRPRKGEIKPNWAPARFPTREVLRAEAERIITINDASGRQQTTVREAVVRALALSAMRGGVYAQRTVLEYLEREDERLHRERRESYDFWQKYQEKSREAAAAAEKAGKPAPDLLPHPDDIVLDAYRLEVRFLGAVDEDGRKAERIADRFYRLGFEMAAYLGEDNCLPTAEDKDGRIGLYMLLHLRGLTHLPPRLRVSPEALEAEILPRARLGMSAWGDDLKRRCLESGIPFVRWHAKLRLPTRPMSKLGIR